MFHCKNCFVSEFQLTNKMLALQLASISLKSTDIQMSQNDRLTGVFKKYLRDVVEQLCEESQNNLSFQL